MQAQLTIFETPGITLDDDPVECQDLTTYRLCESDSGSERVLSHDALAIGDRIPLDFHLFLPPAPVSGADGNYPLVVFLHGWNGSRDSIGGGLESEFIPYAEAGYAVLAYSARAWADSCGPSQQSTLDCMGQWNHLADVRYEVRDTQYFAGLLADELSDDGTPLVDPTKIGVTGVSYGGGQSTILAGLRNRMVDPDGTVVAWNSPGGKAMEIAAAAPFWAWTDLAYSLLPNGRTLDYAQNNSYRGPNGDHPFGIVKSSYVSGLYGTGQVNSVYAPPGSEPDLNAWFAQINAGEPYDELTVGPIVDEIVANHAGYYWISASVEPAPTIFNSGWSDDLFPVMEPVRWLQRARSLHASLRAAIAASDYGHARASSADAAWAKARAREWFDHHLMGIGALPGPVIRAREQDCTGAGAVVHTASSWDELPAGEIWLQQSIGGVVVSSAGGGAVASGTFDPISGGDACARVADSAEVGTLVFDFPAPDPGGYTVLGAPTVIATFTVTGAPAEHAIVVARLLDIDASGDEQLIARAAYRPDELGEQVFQLTPIAHYVADGHHLQLELLGHEAPTARQSNFSFTVDVANVDLRIPVAELPDGNQIHEPADKFLPPGFQRSGLPVPSAGLLALGVLVTLLGGLGVAARCS